MPKLASFLPDQAKIDDINLKFRLRQRDIGLEQENHVRGVIVHHMVNCPECDFSTKHKCIGLKDLAQDYEVKHVKAVFYKLLMD